MNRAFVVQEHTTAPGEVHWDLMVEADAEGGPLVTWKLGKAPVREGEAIAASRQPDHRRAYLEYEGPVSGQRGTVAIWDRGRVEDLEGEPRAARWRARFQGARLAGGWELEDRGPVAWLYPREDA